MFQGKEKRPYWRRGRGAYLLPITVFVVAAAIILTSCGGASSRARSLEEKGDLKGAVAAYREVVGHNPNDVKSLELLGADLMLLGDYNGALPIQERVVALDPKDVQTRVELAFNYLNHQNQPVKAVEHLTQAVAVEPSAKNLSFLGRAQIVIGDPSEAEQSLDKALKTDPKYAYSYVVLLSLLNSQGRSADVSALKEQARVNGVDLSQAIGS